MAKENEKQACMILENMRDRKSTTKEQRWALKIAIDELNISIINQ